MILYIDTTEEEKVTIAVGKAGKLLAKKQFRAKYRQSEKLLPEIDKLLKSVKKSVQNLKGIVVVKGPGPFTAVRIGVAMANALGYALEVPVVGIKVNEFKNLKELIKRSNFCGRDWISRRVVEPFYGKKPNITGSYKGCL